MSAELVEMSAASLAAAVRDGALSARAISDAFLDRIERVDGAIAAFVEVWAEAARARADAIDRARAAGEPLGPLAGVPVAIKDLFVRRGCATTCGSRILEGFVSPYTATAVERLEAAGAVLLGRTNMDEFAMGSSTEHSAFGATHNPFAPDCVPGGSSGGSAAAVSARMAPLALGSDTGGSVRQPAAFCGVPGLKPTYGRVPRFGMVAFASSLDHVAPFGRTVEDLALALEVLAGPDGRDATALSDAPPACLAELGAGVKRLRIGVLGDLPEGVDGEVRARVDEAIAVLAELGATVVPVSLAHLRYAIPAYYLIATSEASSNLARYDGVRFGSRVSDRNDPGLEAMYAATRGAGFGEEVRLRILLGTFSLLSGTYEERYLRATKVRTRIREDLEQAFATCDVLVSPTTPTPAFRLGEKLDDPLQMYASDALTVPANLAGVPALSVPCGFTSAGLPVGLQIVGPALAEPRILRVGAAYERATGFGAVAPAVERRGGGP